MKVLRTPILLAVAALALAGCAKKKITDLQRKEAAHLVSEAEFALTLRDWPRAEAALEKAVAACPDTGAYWISLGAARVRQGKRDAARAAYKGARGAYEAEASGKKTAVDPWLQQVYVLALLGRVNDGRALLATVAKRFHDNRDVRQFIERRQ